MFCLAICVNTVTPPPKFYVHHYITHFVTVPAKFPQKQHFPDFMQFLCGLHNNIKLGLYCNDNQGIILAYVRFEVLMVADVEDYFLKKVWRW